MPKELIDILNVFNENIVIYLILVFVFSYLIISLLTWSFIKPLKYLGISNIVVGIIVVMIRFLLNFIGNFVPDYIKLIEVILPSILKPLLMTGIICVIVGIILLIINYLINKYKIKK